MSTSHVVWGQGYLDACPPDDLIGWCHHCETWQRGRDKRVSIVRREGSVGYSFGCTNGCHMETWSIGVWTCSCSDHVGWDDWDQPDSDEPPDWRIDPDEPCWDDLYADRADHQCQSYIGAPCPH